MASKDTTLRITPVGKLPLRPLALASLLACVHATAAAQSADAAAVQTITISGRSAGNAASVAGFGDIPLSRAPLSATVISTRQLQDAGISSLADITLLDAGVTDAYNPPGYWSQLAVRGFTLDNRDNYRRDGLPINAESTLFTANKAALEVMKGTSGLQAGVSSPGGLVNLVVKRPAGRVRNVELAFTEPGTVSASADLGDSSANALSTGAWGWRLNLSGTRLDPSTRNSRGEAGLAAGAVDFRTSPDGLLQAEFEISHQSQPSKPGFSLLGSRLPDAAQVDPRLSLNNQAWTLPVVMDGQTASLRYTHELTPALQLVAHAMQQRLQTDDRIAFPFGCSAANDYSRYCSDGSFDLYDYRSDGEHRNTDAATLRLQGQAKVAGLQHQFNVGVMGSRLQARFNRQAYNYVGSGMVDGSAVLPPDPTLTDDNTQRDERSTEVFVQDAISWGPHWQLWGGLRHTRLQRSSVRTDSSRATNYQQSFNSPWVALSYRLDSGTTAYTSTGSGIETAVAPNRGRYSNAGQALPALKSRQWEVGLKHQGDTLDWRLAAFDIQRPVWSDLRSSTGLPSASCSNASPCTRKADGQARHRGLEAEAEWRTGAWSLRGSALLLQARREGSADASVNGLRPTNVPQKSLKLQAAYNVATVPGLALLAFVTHEGERMVLPDNSVATPGWTRTDLSLRYAQTTAGGLRIVWRAGLDNIADQRAWKEAPFQYGHAYLYPMAPRTLHASASLNF